MSDALKLPETIHTIPETLAFWAAQTPDAPAIIIPGSPAITYETLWRSANDLAESLRRHGVGRHDRVVLLLPEGPTLAIALLGTMSAAIALPLDFALTVPELGGALQGFNATAAVVLPSISPASRGCLSGLGMSIFELHTDDALGTFALACQSARLPQSDAGPRPEDIAIVYQTSGTTGAPKRVPRTHRRVLLAGRIHQDQFGLDRRDRALSVAPMTLALGGTKVLHGIVAGAALIFPRSPDPTAVWTAIEQHSPTWMHASAGFLELFTSYLRGTPTPQRPSSFRFVRVTAAAISAEICDELSKRLGAPILPSYSSSEIGAIAATLPPPARSKPGSVGQPIQEIRIVAEDDFDALPGAEGEIWVRPKKGFPGYLDDPDLNARVFRPGGWFRTGDIGRLDDDGFLWITGRVQELINRGGAKISLLEVDAVLRAHPAVRAAATFAVPDARLGQDIVAAVAFEQGRTATARELRGWMLGNLSPYKVPRRICVVADLPRTATGKVQRGVLADGFLNGALERSAGE